MLPPVRITRTELIGCIGRIAHRHQNAGCCDPDDIPSPARSNPRETLAYLRKHPVPTVPGWISRADALDAQLLVIAGSWDRWRTERHHLRGGLGDGLFYDQLGARLGIGRDSHERAEGDTRSVRRRRTGRGDPHQPARWRLSTLTDLLRYDEPTQDLARRARRDRTVDHDDPRWDWLTKHRDELVAVAYDLAAAAERHGVTARRWLDELLADLTDDAISPSTPAVLGLAIAEVRTARPVVELTSTHAVHRVLLAGDAFRCEFSGIGCHAHWQSAPPPADAAALVRAIARRRERMDDPRRDQIPAPDTADPADVLRFLRCCPATNRGVRAFDHLDALSLVNALWWLDRSAELAALRFGLRIGLPRDVLRRQIGASYAITRGQGVQDRFDRLISLTTYGRPDEKRARDMRTAGESQLSQEQEWIGANIDTLTHAADVIVATADALMMPDDEREWIDMLASERRHREITTMSLVTFAYAADEIQEALDDEPEHDMAAEALCVLAEVDDFPTVRKLRAATRPMEFTL
ncbi:hypothetical protein [Amycolatopsis sp. cg9]|uniref:hypothetical protein n=1 Tax=Amycolatopsis sp. cg9 TaxID=3238801 RepID=UPI0035232F08